MQKLLNKFEPLIFFSFIFLSMGKITNFIILEQRDWNYLF